MNQAVRPPDTITTPLPKLTVSSRQDLACSKKWHILRVSKTGWGAPRTFAPSVGRGLALHATLAALHAARWDGNLPMGDLPTFARQAAFAARYGPEVNRSAEAETVEEMARLFVDNQDPEDVSNILALETQVEFDYYFRDEPLARISSTLDRVLCRPEAPEKLIIQDIKTTKQRLDLGECFLQLWAAKRKWPGYESYDLELLWLDLESSSVMVDVIPHRMVRGQLRLLTLALLRIRDLPEPLAEPSVEACRWCPARESCQSLDPVRLDGGDADVFRGAGE